MGFLLPVGSRYSRTYPFRSETSTFHKSAHSPGVAVGLLWVMGRALYAAGYHQAVDKRRPGFFIQSTACTLLFIGAIAGIRRQAFGG